MGGALGAGLVVRVTRTALRIGECVHQLMRVRRRRREALESDRLGGEGAADGVCDPCGGRCVATARPAATAHPAKARTAAAGVVGGASSMERMTRCGRRRR